MDVVILACFLFGIGERIRLWRLLWLQDMVAQGAEGEVGRAIGGG